VLLNVLTSVLKFADIKTPYSKSGLGGGSNLTSSFPSTKYCPGAHVLHDDDAEKLCEPSAHSLQMSAPPW
jgi:hypothetical protein